MKDLILERLKTGPLTPRNLQLQFSRRKIDCDLKTIQAAFDELEKSGQILQLDGEWWLRDETFMQGYVLTANGNVYKIIDLTGRSCYVNMDRSKGALCMDEVIVHKKAGEVRWNVVKFVHRAHEVINGKVQRKDGRLILKPDFQLPYDIVLHTDNIPESTRNLYAKARVTRWGTCQWKFENRRGHNICSAMEADLLEFYESETGPDVSSMLDELGMRPPFLWEELDSAQVIIKNTSFDACGRCDLRLVPTYTIDAGDCRSYDDALSIYEHPDRFKLLVHIADVTHFVDAESPLDRAAAYRGQSLYSDKLESSMLPLDFVEKTSSLEPGHDRYALTVELDFDREGQLLDHSIYRSIISVDRHLTYYQVTRMLKDVCCTKDQLRLGSMLKLARKLKTKADRRGAVCFHGFRSQPGFLTSPLEDSYNAHDLVEQLMIAANVAIANDLAGKNLPALYRTHPFFGPEKAARIADTYSASGIKLPQPVEQTPLHDLIAAIPTDNPYTASRVFRQLCHNIEKSYYTIHPTFHYGLNLDAYCNFTAPLRRYADLVIHRIVKDCLIDGRDVWEPAELERLCRHLNRVEICQESAIGEISHSLRSLEATYFQGQRASGIVTSIVNNGFYVQLKGGLTGFVDEASLQGFWRPKPETGQFVCVYSGWHIDLGQKVEIEIGGLHNHTRQIKFFYVPPAKG